MKQCCTVCVWCIHPKNSAVLVSIRKIGNPSSYESILAICDKAFNYLVLLALRNAHAINIADKFVAPLCLTFGTPYFASSDNDDNIAGDVMHFAARLLGFKQLTIVRYNAKADSKVERKFKDVKQLLSIEFSEGNIY